MPRRHVYHILLLLTISWSHCDALTVIAKFNMNGVNGTITFAQQSPAVNKTVITVSLSGLDQYPSEHFPWHIHQYPFKTQPNLCSAASGHYDPLMSKDQQNYSTLCVNDNSLCGIGDLNRKFGPLYPNSTSNETFVDMHLPLYGVHSIVGRSVVIRRKHFGRWVCANIEYASGVTVAYSPFRYVLVGDIYFIEPYEPANFTTVFTSLSYQNESVNSTDHNWHVHKNLIGVNGQCIEGGEHYNPRNIPTDKPTYQIYCSPSNQTGCEVGDLSGKSSRLNFTNGHAALFYSDTELSLRINKLSETIVGRSIVVHAEDGNNSRIACANILEYTPRTAVARFQEDGVRGRITFHQVSPFSPTTVTVELSGLSSRASGYHVHDFPVDETVPGSGKCTDNFAGGHFNPRNVVRNESSPTTFDAYEIGDLSGKYGSLAGQDSINVDYLDPYLPLFGVDSIVGRSIVIHYPNGSQWLCANIQYDMETVSVTVNITSGTLQGTLVLTQLANDPFSETTIFLDVDYTSPPISVISMSSMSTQLLSTSVMSMSFDPDPMNTMNTMNTINMDMTPSPTDKPGGRRRDVFKRQTQESSSFIHLSIQTSCDEGASAFNPYVASLTCSPDNQLACPVGDLTGKHGVLSERSLLTDLNLPLDYITASWLTIRQGDVNSSLIVCMPLPTPITSSIVISTSTTSAATPITSETAAPTTIPATITTVNLGGLSTSTTGIGPTTATTTTATGTSPTTATGTSPPTATGISPTTATGISPTTATGTSSPTATGASPTTATGISPTTATGTSPTTATGTSPTTATGTSPTTATGTSPTTATGTSPTTATGTSATTTTGISPTSTTGSKNNKTTIIIASGTAGGVILIALLVLLLVAISYCMWRRHKKRSQYFGGSGRSTIEYKHLPVELSKRSKFKRKKKRGDNTDGEDCVEL